MRVDRGVLLRSLLLGASAAQAAPFADRRASLGQQIHAIEVQLQRLEQQLAQDLAELAALGLPGAPGSGPAAGSTGASAPPGSSSLAAAASSVFASLSSVASSLSAAAPTAATLALSSTAAPSSPTVALSSSASASSSSSSSSSVANSGINSSSSPSSSAAATSSMAPASTAVAVSSNITAADTCTNLCSSLSFAGSDVAVTPYLCEAHAANDNVTVTGGQADAGCGSSIAPSVGICRVTLGITTSDASETYVEVWLPNDDTTAWNGRTISTDNGGLSGCVAYDQLQYLTGLGYTAFGDNGGHNSSAFDGSAFLNNNERVVDWVYRARHESVTAGKQVVQQFYGQPQTYAYYIGCSTGGQQGLHAAQYYPDDFDGIIAGSAAADMNHLEDWTLRFNQLTGTSNASTSFLSENAWIFVQSYVFEQCDEALDGVNDGILEDPTICAFNASAIPVCADGTTPDDSNVTCLTSTQVTTVEQVFTALYDSDGQLLYPALLYGSQVDAFRLGLLDGSTQAIANDWFANAVYNNSNFDSSTVGQADYTKADQVDALHGNASSFSGDLSAFRDAGKKLLIYHGMADPMVSGANSQRYYQKVAHTLGLSDNTQIDPFLRLFRISGMAHCGVGGISGAGAWMFGQTGEAAADGVAQNVVDTIVDWVENGNGPDTLTGTKFNYDTPSYGVEFQRPHCHFPYRTTYTGSGDWTDAASWNCTYIDDWQDCGVGALPRTCNTDGSFT